MKLVQISRAFCMLVSLMTISSVSFAGPQANQVPATATQSAQAGDQPSLAAIRAACAEDAQKLCARVQPGGGRIVACLKEHKDSLSDRCKQAAGLAANPSSSSAPSAPSAPSASPSAGANASGATASAPEAASASSGAAAGSPAKSSRSAAKPGVPAAGSHAKAAPTLKGAADPVVLGEHFVQRAVIDTKQGGMTAVTVHVPEKWHFEGKIEWNYAWVEVPVATSWHAENPANAEAYFQYPLLRMSIVDVAPRLRQYVKNPKPGERTFSGAIYMAPVPPMQAMATFIKNIRGDVTNLKWLGQQDLPDLGKALRLDLAAWPTNHGVAIKIGYDLNGQPVEEAFFGVYYLNKAGAPAVQAGHQAIGANEIQQTDWGFDGLQSFRAPAGTLDKRMPVYCLIAKSVQYDPKWSARQQAILATLVQMFNQKLKQGWDQIRAADALTDETMRQQRQFLDNVGRQEAAMRSSGGGSGNSVDGFLRTDDSGGGRGGGRTSADNLSDLLRNVDTMNDPSTGGTKEVSNLGGYNHFTDGFGNYRTYDNPNDTPENHNENGTWQRMTVAP
jgi:hypothetical protein